MKLYEVRRFSSESEKRAVEYVKEYTKEAYTQKYRYTPEVLKLDDGRTKYTLRIKAKQVATVCKYLMTYFGEEIQNLSSIVADILANDPKATAHTKYIVEGNGYTCFVYVGDDAGNIHIALYLDAEANEETETQNETNEEDKKMNNTTKAMVVEFCSNCETEIEMRWDVKTQGYKATCPVCGNLLMLCDECQHRGEDGEDLDDCDFDGRDGSCRFNPKGNVGNSQDSNRVYCPVLGGWIMYYDACRGGCEYDSETDTCKLSRNNTRKGGDA